jgi:energy-coupling factor transporter ATP-binding protein EcfA2
MTSASLITRDTRAGDAPPAYFLSLSIENFRCFGPRQTLDLSNGNDRPAPWTVIIGNNGVGKTSLLQWLAQFYQTYSAWETGRAGVGDLSDELMAGDRDFAERTQSFARIYLGYGFAPQRRQTVGVSTPTIMAYGRTVTVDGVPENLKGLFCCGYGAARRMGRTLLSGGGDFDSCATLFDDSAELTNAEEWFLQSDYAAHKEGPDQQQAAERLLRVKDALIPLLPEVTDLRGGIRSFGYTPFVEVKTPYGWVQLQRLSLGYRAMIAWTVDFANRLFSRYPNSENPLAEPAVALGSVDEIT